MKKVLFTDKPDQAMCFKSFVAANAAGDENLGAGMYRVEGKGGIHLIPVHPAIKGILFVKEISE